MEGGQHAHSVTPTDGDTEVLAAGGSEVPEHGPVENLRVCPQCSCRILGGTHSAPLAARR